MTANLACQPTSLPAARPRGSRSLARLEAGFISINDISMSSFISDFEWRDSGSGPWPLAHGAGRDFALPSGQGHCHHNRGPVGDVATMPTPEAADWGARRESTGADQEFRCRHRRCRIGGLSAALALQRSGFRVTVYEQAPQLLEVGADCHFSPTAAHGLNFLGLHDALVEHSYTPENQFIRHWQDGRVLMTVNRGTSLLEKYGERYYLIHRAICTTCWRPPCAPMMPTRYGSVAASPACRRPMGAWRSGFPMASARAPMPSSAQTGAAPRFATCCSARGHHGSPATSRGAAWCQPGTPAVSCSTRPPASSLARTHGQPISGAGGKQVNIVAFAERSDWTQEGWSIHSTVEELLDEFAGWHPDVRRLLAATPRICCSSGPVRPRPLASWSAGNVGLLGDAAHPILPSLATARSLPSRTGSYSPGRSRRHRASARRSHAMKGRGRERAAFVVLESRTRSGSSTATDPRATPRRRAMRPLTRAWDCSATIRPPRLCDRPRPRLAATQAGATRLDFARTVEAASQNSVPPLVQREIPHQRNARDQHERRQPGRAKPDARERLFGVLSGRFREAEPGNEHQPDCPAASPSFWTKARNAMCAPACRTPERHSS